MRPIRPLFAVRSRRSTRSRTSSVAAVALGAALVLTATACGPSEDNAAGDSSSAQPGDSNGDDKIQIPDAWKDKLKENGIDLDEWKNGAWKNWNKDDWLREAGDFVNPIIEDLWDPDRMRDADKNPDRGVDENDISGDQGVTDPTPKPVEAAAVKAPYHDQVAESGKLFFDGPEGSMVCSATVVKDPAHPGKSNMVWTAGHCVHAGA
ncbi:hypothetical protein GT038_01350, partial [Streptomyces sp. SID337]|nr:hypothetical protein [Streptomyces sp. SID337]